MNKARIETKPFAEKTKAREVLFFELEYVAVAGRQMMFETLQQTLKARDIELTPALFSRYGLASRPGKAIQMLLEAIGRAPLADALAIQVEQQLTRALSEKAVLNKDLPALIQAAQSRNIQVVALSAWPEAAARDLMKKTGLFDLGVDLVAMDSHDPIFPRADHWLRILKQRGQDHLPLIAMVASRAACKGALTAGATCIVLPDAYTAFEDFTGAKTVLEALGEMSPADLLDMVSRR
jgi:beta-phosphoglucomutase-like phosphatase (HAD superfamily)